MTSQPNQFLITAIVRDPHPLTPINGGNYFRIAYLHGDDGHMFHYHQIEAQGFRVTSVKVVPADQANESDLTDLQGNLPEVEGIPIVEGTNE